MSERKRPHIDEEPVQFQLDEFDPQVAQRFLPDWELVITGPRVAFHQDLKRENDSLLRNRLLIDLESHKINVEVIDLNSDKIHSETFASLEGVSEVRMHSRFGNAWVTFKSADRYLIFQPQSMDVAITTSEPVGWMLMR